MFSIIYIFSDISVLEFLFRSKFTLSLTMGWKCSRQKGSGQISSYYNAKSRLSESLKIRHLNASFIEMLSMQYIFNFDS